jgi:hypothetical protein
VSGRPKKQSLLVIGPGNLVVNERVFKVKRVDHWTPRDWTTEVQSTVQDEVYDFAIVLPTAERGEFFWDQLAWRVHRGVTVLIPSRRDLWDLKQLYGTVQLRRYKYTWAVAQFSELRDYKGVDCHA